MIVDLAKEDILGRGKGVSKAGKGMVIEHPPAMSNTVPQYFKELGLTVLGEHLEEDWYDEAYIRFHRFLLCLKG